MATAKARRTQDLAIREPGVIASARARPGSEAELERALREAAGPTRAQPSCVEFRLIRQKGDPSTIIGYERCVSAADHQNHLEGAHVEALMQRMAAVLARPPTIVSYEVHDE